MNTQRIKATIARLQARIARLERVVSQPDELAASFSHGVGNMTAAQARRRQRQHEAGRKRFAEYEKAVKDLDFWRARLAAVETGEAHENGQPRADAPSKLREQALDRSYVAWLRATLQPGDKVVLLMSEAVRTLEKKNARTVRLAGSPTLWTYEEIAPASPEGTACDTATLARMWSEWLHEQDDISR